jgi:hypothetical protein
MRPCMRPLHVNVGNPKLHSLHTCTREPPCSGSLIGAPYSRARETLPRSRAQARERRRADTPALWCRADAPALMASHFAYHAEARSRSFSQESPNVVVVHVTRARLCAKAVPSILARTHAARTHLPESNTLTFCLASDLGPFNLRHLSILRSPRDLSSSTSSCKSESPQARMCRLVPPPHMPRRLRVSVCRGARPPTRPIGGRGATPPPRYPARES